MAEENRNDDTVKRQDNKKKPRMKMTIKKKAVIIILVFSVLLIAISCFVSSWVIINMMRDNFQDKATAIAATTAEVIDIDAYARVKNAVKDIYDKTENKVTSDDWGSPAFDEYTARFSEIERNEDFISVRDQLRVIAKASDVDCIYLSFLDIEREQLVYVIDSDEEDPCPPGCIDPVYDQNRRVLTDPEYGFPAYQTNTDAYGALMTAGIPLHDADGSVIGYSFTDIQMKEVRHLGFLFGMRLLTSLILFSIVFCVILIQIIDRILVKPIKNLAKTAENYYKDNNTSPFHNKFEGLDIHTNDEIELLADSMKHMERDINEHVSQLIRVNDELSETQTFATEMTRLANIDSLTGVKNKTAYDRDSEELENSIKSRTAEFGIVMIDLNGMKKLNDTYGHECGNEAIIGLSKVICGVFVHSPVYRIGGDEFVVILENSDYKKRAELVELFKNDIDTLRNDTTLDPWKRISAAIGCAAYDRDKDTAVNDVFSRADQTMYKNKAEMKNEAARKGRQSRS